MFELDSDIFVIVAGIILGLLIIKFLAKFIFRLIGIAVLLLAVLFYTYFYTDFFENHQDNAIVQEVEDKIDFVSVLSFQKEHCVEGPKSRTDSITCECIIAPLVEDLRTKFTDAEIEALEKDKQKYLKEILAALKRNQSEIIRELKKRKAIDVWNKIVRDLKKGRFLQK